MKNILKTLMLIAGIALFTTASAQDRRPAQREVKPEVRAEKRTALLKDKLLLTDEQKEKVYAATLRMEQQRTTDRDQVKKNREAFDAEMQSILTPEQMEKYEAMREERKEAVKARMEERRNADKSKTQESEDPKLDAPKN